MSNHREQIIAAAQGKVAEPLLGATFAKPRGASTAGAGGAAGIVGGLWAGAQHERAAAVGIRFGSPGALAVTPTSLVTVAVRVSFGGQITEITEILSVVPLKAVDSVEVKRVGFAGVMKVSVGGSSFKLEGKVAALRGFADAVRHAKVAAT